MQLTSNPVKMKWEGPLIRVYCTITFDSLCVCYYQFMVALDKIYFSLYSITVLFYLLIMSVVVADRVCMVESIQRVADTSQYLMFSLQLTPDITNIKI